LLQCSDTGSVATVPESAPRIGDLNTAYLKLKTYRPLETTLLSRRQPNLRSSTELECGHSAHTRTVPKSSHRRRHISACRLYQRGTSDGHPYDMKAALKESKRFRWLHLLLLAAVYRAIKTSDDTRNGTSRGQITCSSAVLT
jgi:hypothetical protein